MYKELFRDLDIRSVIGDLERKISDEILKFNSQYLFDTSELDLIDYFIKKYTMYPIGLDTDNISVEQSEINIDVSQDLTKAIRDRSKPFYIKGNRIKYFIPYSGEKTLFFCKATFSGLSNPFGIVNESEIIVRVDTLDYDEEEIKHSFKKTLSNLFSRIEWINSDVITFNNSIKSKVLDQITARKNKLTKDNELINKLGYPIRKREDIPKAFVTPSIKKKIIAKLPKATPGKSIEDSFLEISIYEEILSIVHSMSIAMERSPKTFGKLSEEEIRDHFLMVLNSQFEGKASGETFNYEGKTDILIRERDKNIFIAECKFWKGESTLLKTIDQLLGYASWRDTKTAIFIFNKNKDLTSVLRKISETVKKHNNFIKSVTYKSETGFRYSFHHKNDRERELLLTILVFDIPK